MSVSMTLGKECGKFWGCAARQGQRVFQFNFEINFRKPTLLELTNNFKYTAVN